VTSRTITVVGGVRLRRRACGPGSGDGGRAASMAVGQWRRWLGSEDGGADWAAVTAVKMKGFDLNLEM